MQERIQVDAVIKGTLYRLQCLVQNLSQPVYQTTKLPAVGSEAVNRAPGSLTT
jgi:hypothetical protein